METGETSMLEFFTQCVARNRNIPDTSWMLGSGARILTMQAGFGLLESATCRKRNAANIMMKNVGDLVLAALIYQACAYGIIYGKDVGGLGIIGDPNAEITDFAAWFFHFSFASTAATIDSGCVAERVNYFAYVLLSAFTAAFIYPVTAHWVWNSDGWLAKLGFIDFAGGGVVHMIGAFSGLCCCLVAGPRIGRFYKYRTWQGKFARLFFHETRSSLYYQQPIGEEEYRQYDPITSTSNPVQTLFGTLVLWIGWYGFNGGSTLGLSGDRDMAAAKIFVVTTLGAAGGGLGASLVSMFLMRKQKRLIVQVPDLCNGILGGLVGVTAGAPFFNTGIATLLGMISGVVVMGAVKILEMRMIDDVVSAIPVHGIAGARGVFFVGLFANPDCAFPETARLDTGGFSPRGVFYGGELSFLGAQCIGILAIGIFSFFSTWVFLTVLHFAPHNCTDIRAESWNEIIGMDLAEHMHDDGIGFAREESRAAMKAFALRPDVASLLCGIDSEKKQKQFKQFELEHVMKQLDAKEQEKRFKSAHHWTLLNKRMTRLERAFDRHLFRVDVQLKETNMYLRMLADRDNSAFCQPIGDLDIGSVNLHFVETANCQKTLSVAKDMQLDEERKNAVLKIERWWHKRFHLADANFRLRFLVSWQYSTHPNFNADKPFESTAFRPWHYLGSAHKADHAFDERGTETTILTCAF